MSEAAFQTAWESDTRFRPRLRPVGAAPVPDLAERVRRAAAGEGALGAAAAFHLREPGKLVRGRLALQACDALDVPGEEAMGLAVVCELLHNAALVHGDLQDRDEARRGRPAVWAAFGETLAVNLGDHFFVQAMGEASTLAAGDPVRQRQLMGAVTQAARSALLGGTRGALAAAAGDLSMGEYETLARGRTGPLLALPVEGALILAGETSLRRSAAREAMGRFALAYRIQEDLLDLFGLRDAGPLSTNLHLDRPHAVATLHREGLEGRERERFEAFLEARPRSRSDIERWARSLRLSPAVGAAVAALDAARVEGERRLAGLPSALRAALAAATQRLLRPTHFVRPLCLGLPDEADSPGA